METSKLRSVFGLIFLFIVMVLTGSALSFAYLWLNGVIKGINELPFHICALSAVLFGLLMFFIPKVVISLFKIKIMSLSLVVVIIGCLGFTYFKWALYVAADFDDFHGSRSGIHYTGWYSELFNEDFTDENGEPYTEEQLRLIIDEMRETSVYDYYKEIGETDRLNALSIDETRDLASISYYEYRGYIQSLEGLSTPSATVTAAVRAVLDEYNSSRYSYYCDLTQSGEISGTFYMENPVRLFDVVKRINAEGRWEYDDITVSGGLLWIVWFLEFLLICSPAIFGTIGAVREMKKYKPRPKNVEFRESTIDDTAGLFDDDWRR
jgi:hypothetical protein